MRNKYQCIRTCFAYGRKWEKGELLDTDFIPNHHFVIISGQPTLPLPRKVNVITTTNQNAFDPQAPIRSSDPDNFSQMQGEGMALKIGMANGLGDTKPMASMKEYKTNIDAMEL